VGRTSESDREQSLIFILSKRSHHCNTLQCMFRPDPFPLLHTSTRHIKMAALPSGESMEARGNEDMSTGPRTAFAPVPRRRLHHHDNQGSSLSRNREPLPVMRVGFPKR
jgi:hypothetical protein